MLTYWSSLQTLRNSSQPCAQVPVRSRPELTASWKLISDAISSVHGILAHSQVREAPLYILIFYLNNVFASVSQPITLSRFEAVRNKSKDHRQNTHPVRTGNNLCTNQWCLAGPMSIQSGIRNVCPLSMLLYALCLHPIICSLEETLPGLQIGRS